MNPVPSAKPIAATDDIIRTIIPRMLSDDLPIFITTHFSDVQKKDLRDILNRYARLRKDRGIHFMDFLFSFKDDFYSKPAEEIDTTLKAMYDLISVFIHKGLYVKIYMIDAYSNGEHARHAMHIVGVHKGSVVIKNSWADETYHKVNLADTLRLQTYRFKVYMLGFLFPYKNYTDIPAYFRSNIISTPHPLQIKYINELKNYMLGKPELSTRRKRKLTGIKYRRGDLVRYNDGTTVVPAMFLYGNPEWANIQISHNVEAEVLWVKWAEIRTWKPSSTPIPMYMVYDAAYLAASDEHLLELGYPNMDPDNVRKTAKLILRYVDPSEKKRLFEKGDKIVYKKTIGVFDSYEDGRRAGIFIYPASGGNKIIVPLQEIAPIEVNEDSSSGSEEHDVPLQEIAPIVVNDDSSSGSEDHDSLSEPTVKDKGIIDLTNQPTDDEDDETIDLTKPVDSPIAKRVVNRRALRAKRDVKSPGKPSKKNKNIAVCKDHQERSIYTKRCVKRCSEFQDRYAAVHPEAVKNKNRCVTIRCPPGKIMNTATKRCNKESYYRKKMKR
jgi:hypothetical protein